MCALRGNDVPPRMVRTSGSVPHTASVGVRSVRSQVQDACLALLLIEEASAGMWRKTISYMLAGLMVIGSAGLFVLGLMGHWEPGVRFALA
jgi:hypothetical protein